MEMKVFGGFEIFAETSVENDFSIANEGEIFSIDILGIREDVKVKYEFWSDYRTIAVLVEDEVVELIQSALIDNLKTGFRYPLSELNIRYEYQCVIEALLPLLAKNIEKGMLYRSVPGDFNRRQATGVPMYFIGPQIYADDLSFPEGILYFYDVDENVIDIKKDVDIIKLSKKHVDFFRKIDAMYAMIENTRPNALQFIRENILKE